MNTPVTVVPSYPLSPDGRFRFDQPRRKEPKGGREEILRWIYFREDKGEDVGSNENYLLLPCPEGWPCWNAGDKYSDFTHFCFLARRYPGVTFPVYADLLQEDAGYDVIVVMNRCCRVEREYRLFSLPSKVSWDSYGRNLIIECDTPEDRKARREYALKEYEAAKPFIGGGDAKEGSPVHDMSRLENYLHFYDPAFCGPDPFKYAVRLRNNYLHEAGTPWLVLYDENILD